MHICISLWCASNTVVSGATAISSSGDIASKKGNITGKAGPFHFFMRWHKWNDYNAYCCRCEYGP